MALLHSAELIHLTTGHSESNAKVLTYKIIRCLVDKMYGCQQLCYKYVRLSLCIYLIWDSLSRGRMSISHRFFSMKHIMPKFMRHDRSGPIGTLTGCIIHRLLYSNHVLCRDCFCCSPL